MSQIKISHLTFAYETSPELIFDDVSFLIDTDWKLGFIGRNGRGKTTFLKLLLGAYPYRGSILANVQFAYFPYPITDASQDTLDILQHQNGHVPLWRWQKELSLLEVPEDALKRPFATLSQGEQTKVLLAGLFLQENGFVLIDEPTNHLDVWARQVVSRYLQGQKGFILVSHDRMFLDGCIDHVLSINKNGVELQKGNFSSWQQNKIRQDQFELAENEKRQKEIKKLAAAAKQAVHWADEVEKTKKTGRDASGIKPDKGYIGHMAAKKMQLAKNIEGRRQKAVVEKEKLLKNIERAAPLALKPLAYPQEYLITARELSIFYGEKQAVKEVSFTLHRGERLAITGKNGSGKTSILKLLLGEPLAYTGEFTYPGRLSISYVSQDTSFLQGSLTRFAEQEGLAQSLFFAILNKLDFARSQFDRDMAFFSAGQKKKVLLAKSLCQQAHLYVWDEPLNYVDVLSRIQIEELLLKYVPTMIFVEHDQAFLERVATKQVVLV